MKKLLIFAVMLWVAWCYAAPTVIIDTGSIHCNNDAYVFVNGGSITNLTSGTPFKSTSTKSCSAATTFVGPEGTLDALVITPAGDMGSTTVSVVSGSYHPNTSSSVIQWWNVNPTTLQPCSLEFRFRNSYLNSLTLANLAVWEYSGGWVKLSETITTSNVGTAITSVSFGNVNFTSSKGDHPIIIADKNDNTLPVELSGFTATLSMGNGIQLQWITQSETNLSGYRIYRGIAEELEAATMLDTFIEGSNTSQTQSYVYIDKELFEPGTYYYWLESLDFDGSTSFFGPAIVRFNPDGEGGNTTPVTKGLDRVYPNPFNPSTTIRYGLTQNGPVRIDIHNLRGQLIRTIDQGNQAAGYHSYAWNGTAENGQRLGSGVYLIRVSINRETWTQKVLLLK